jgi:tetratricopeptide (TPR) repeat protein
MAPGAREQVEAAMKAAHAEPDNAAAVARFGRFLLGYRFDESALPCFQRARKLEPTSYRWPYYVGILEQRRGHHRAAAEAFEAVLELKPGDAPTLVRLADSLSASGELEPARENYLRALKVEPSARASYGLGAVYARMGNNEKAIEHLGKACGAFSKYGKARRLLAEVYEKAGQPEKAREQEVLIRGGADREPPLEDPLQAQAADLEFSAAKHTEAGLALVEQGLPRAAIGEFRSALEIDPRALGAHLHSIVAYQQLSDLESARKHFEQAVGISPDEPMAYLYLARALVGAGRQPEAEQVLTALTKVDAGNAQAWAMLGDCAWRGSQRDRADQHYREAFRLDAESELANRGMGLVAHSRGDHTAAIRHLAKAQTLPGSEALVALETLAASHRAAGDRKSAIQALRQARAVANLHGPAEAVGRINAQLASLE